LKEIEPEYAEKVRNVAKLVRDKAIAAYGDKKNLYKVKLFKGKDPSEYTWLDWDKKPDSTILKKIKARISQETIETDEIKSLKKQLREIDEWFHQGINKVGQNAWNQQEEKAGNIRKRLFDLTNDAYGESKLQQISSTLDYGDKNGDEIYHNLVRAFRSDKEASLFLQRAGIDGIRYPAGSLSGMKSDKAKNYVVFDENAVEIVEKAK